MTPPGPPLLPTMLPTHWLPSSPLPTHASTKISNPPKTSFHPGKRGISPGDSSGISPFLAYQKLDGLRNTRNARQRRRGILTARKQVRSVAGMCMWYSSCVPNKHVCFALCVLNFRPLFFFHPGDRKGSPSPPHPLFHPRLRPVFRPVGEKRLFGFFGRTPIFNQDLGS